MSTSNTDLSCPAESLKDVEKWVSSLSKEKIEDLKTTKAELVETFINAYMTLRLALTNLETPKSNSRRESKTNNDSFLQHCANNDVLLKIFDFADSFDLSNMCCCCWRFLRLTRRVIDIRTKGTVFANMKSTGLLHAQDQITETGMYRPRRCLPFLFNGLSEHVQVSNAGLAIVNGTYYCDQVTANGFEFKKLWAAESRTNPGNVQDMEYDEEGQACYIAKRFDAQIPFWYIFVKTRSGNCRFHYWAPLLLQVDTDNDEVNAEMQKYPPDTLRLHERNHQAWQAFDVISSPPPVVSYLHPG